MADDKDAPTTCPGCGKEKKTKRVQLKYVNDVTVDTYLCSTCAAEKKQVVTDG